MTGHVIKKLVLSSEGSCHAFDYPDWPTIEREIRSLANRAGRIELFDETSNLWTLMINGQPGAYAIDVIPNDDEAAMFVSKHTCDDTLVAVDLDECRADQISKDIDEVVRVSRAAVADGNYVETENMKWVFYRQ